MEDNEAGPLSKIFGGLVAIIVVLVLIVVAGGALGWVTSFKGVDSGEVCVVREGGIFDGRDIKEIRQPGSGPKPIGAWNHQDCLPITERDSNDVLVDKDGNALDQTFPTRDRVQVVADGQALYQLTTDPELVEKFYRGYGRRKWGGDDLSSDEGWLNFQRQRIAPVILDAQREVIGEYDCTSLNNLCQYVQNPEVAVKGTDQKDNQPSTDNTQNLTEAQRKLSERIRDKLKTAFRGEFFENVRYQNLRIRFESGVKQRIDNAQALRTETANAKLEAEKKVAEAKGEANRKAEVAKGNRQAAFQQAQAYRTNPNQAVLDRIEKFCGGEGCDPQVLGGNLDSIISQIGSRAGDGS